MRVAWLYPRPKSSIRRSQQANLEPDQLSAIDLLPQFGISAVLIDPFPFPLNPLAHAHSVYSGLDPIRALKVLTETRNYDVIMSVGESSAALLLPLRRLLGRKLP